MAPTRAALGFVLVVSVAASGCTLDDGPGHTPFAAATTTTTTTTTVDRTPPVEIHVVDVAAQGCDRPQTRRGVATYVADGIVLTAGHVVAGELRRLEIDGRPSRVLALDERRDLALVVVDEHLDNDDNDDTAVERLPPPGRVVGGPVLGPATIVGHSGSSPVEVTRLLTLSVDDLSAGVLHEREAIELDRLVERGDSGSPVVDPRGRVVGVVTLRRSGTGTSFASVPPTDLSELLGDAPLARPPGCV